MRLPYLFLFFTIITSETNAQTWSETEFKKANTAEKVDYLTNEEKEVIFFMNLSRLDGAKFFDTFLQDYINNYNKSVKPYRNYNELKITENDAYYISLKKHLYRIKNLNMLSPDQKLTVASKNHALDLYLNNRDTHESSNGESMSKRLMKIYPDATLAENIDFGFNKGLDIVCHLLLDSGVPSLGHRNNILDQKYNFNFVGLSIQKHKTHKYCTVIDFVAKRDSINATK